MQAIKKVTKILLMRIRKNVHFIIFSALFALTTCVEPFTPDINKSEDNIVIIGQLIETDSIQKVEISQSSGYNTREKLPIGGCAIYVEDDEGNIFYYTEQEEGIYTCHIEPQYINIGTSYRLVVNTPNENLYISEYDKMVECPDLDTIYYTITKNVTGVQQEEEMGVQFYLKAKSEGNQSIYCRWALDETWEYRATTGADGITRYGHNTSIPYFHVPVCWTNKNIASIYTEQLSNQLKSFKINYVSNETSRLYHKYCLHIRQFGLNEKAYLFWNSLGSQFSDQGEIYEKQPQSINSNITNYHNDQEIVLGYFNTASVKEKRIFVKRDWKKLYVPEYCTFERFPTSPDGWPSFAYFNSYEKIMSPDKACFDCTVRGGTSIKPDFWKD